MKKIISLILVCVMALSLAACGTKAPAETTAPATTEPAVSVESALAVLEDIWANYGEDEKFFVVGGNMENPVDGAPGNYDMAYAENLSWNLLVPAEQLANVDQAATMIHAMNANTFTSGVVHLTEGTDAAAFAQVMRDAIQGNMWMCGFPETLTVAVIGGEYVLIAFGVNDAMNPFMTHFAEAFPGADILFNEAVEG
jgi:predicted small lipoprotein YifL